MADIYLGEIRMFPFPFAPRDWMNCDGSTLQISQNQALYTLLGVQFGGDGRTTFNLPDLRARTIVGTMSGTPGSSDTNTNRIPQNVAGKTGGSDSVAIPANAFPAHNHTVVANNAPGNQIYTGPQPGGTSSQNYPSQPGLPATTQLPAPISLFVPATTGGLTPQTLSPTTVAVSGGGAAHENRQPYLAIGFCICTVGVFPNRD